jgi:hypothetical protein
MTFRRKHSWILLAIISAIVLTSGPRNAMAFKKRLQGSVTGGLYISPEKDFRVAIPVQEAAGGGLYDESGKHGDFDGSQVTFVDDFGSFYRVISWKTVRAISVDGLNVFHDIREQQTINTEWGRALRVIDIEKEGSEIVVTSIKDGGAPQTSKPDRITANAIFNANNRTYLVSAGYPIYQAKNEAVQEQVKIKLERFLGGFQTLEPPSPKKKKK